MMPEALVERTLRAMQKNPDSVTCDYRFIFFASYLGISLRGAIFRLAHRVKNYLSTPYSHFV